MRRRRVGKQAVLLLAHGTPESIDQIPEYLRNITGGRPLPDTVVAEIQHRYGLIGHSPLTEITLEQGSMVERELAAAGHPVRVYVGMRNWHPYITDVMRQIKADGVQKLAVVCLAPQNSRTSVGLYRRAIEAEADGLTIDFTEGWANHPLLAEAFAERLRPTLARATAEAGHPVPVLFTAHSVPCRTIQTPPDGQGQPDSYAEDAKATAAAVAALVPEIPHWWFAFQSQGQSGGTWVGPTVEQTLDAIAREGIRHLVLDPIGFLCDHVEILYDIDIQFQQYSHQLGIQLVRPESLNASLCLAHAIAEVTISALVRLGVSPQVMG